MMNPSKLIDIIATLASYDSELTIYAAKPWTCNSDAIVARDADQGGIPHEAESCDAEYFIEVFIAKEFIEGWTASEARPTSAREQCERLIHYATHDA